MLTRKKTFLLRIIVYALFSSVLISIGGTIVDIHVAHEGPQPQFANQVSAGIHTSPVAGTEPQGQGKHGSVEHDGYSQPCPTGGGYCVCTWHPAHWQWIHN